MKNQIKKIVAIGVMTIMVFTLASCGKEEAKVYKAAMEPTFPPFDTTDKETGDLTGFDVDLMEAIAKDQNFTLKWENMKFDGLIPALKAGNIDIIASGMYASKERGKEVSFSDSYYESGLVLAVQEKNNKVKGLDDLDKNMILGGQVGTTGGDAVQDLEKKGKIKAAKIYDGVDTAVMDLQNGNIDGLINDKPVTETYMAQQPGKIKMVGKSLSAEPYGIAVKKDNNELLDKINAGLKNLKDSGEYDKLYKKWFK